MQILANLPIFHPYEKIPKETPEITYLFNILLGEMNCLNLEM